MRLDLEEDIFLYTIKEFSLVVVYRTLLGTSLQKLQVLMVRS